MPLLISGCGNMKMIIVLLIIGVFLLVGASLVSGAGWSSYVLEENGTGIDAANVTAVLINNNYVNSTLTNANGFFNITITDDTNVKLISSKSGYLTDTSQDLPKITDNQIVPFNITLDRAQPGNITGRITNTTGSAIDGANISAIQGSSTIKSTLSDSNGDYALIDLLDGTYTIGADAIYYTTQNTTNVVLLPNSITSVNFSLIYETIPPIISDVSATLITSSEAVIIWQTNEDANSSVNYWKENQTVLNSYSSTLVSSHLMRLSSLSSSTFYYYIVSSCDFVGNCNSSQTYNFTTLAQGGNGIDDDGGSGGIGTLTTITRILSKGAKVAFRIEGEIHYIEIIEITNTGVTINISSTPQQVVLNIGEEKKFEVTDDDYYDILIRLNDIDNNLANITTSYIHEKFLPGQLFDIRLEVENSLMESFSEFVVIVTFESFGVEPTPINLLFTILDENGKEVYSEDEEIIVETEEVLRKTFKGSYLKKGKYTFILTTLYNVDVVDEFRADFEITGRKVNWIWIIGGIVVGILIIGLVWWIIKRKKRRAYKHRREEPKSFKGKVSEILEEGGIKDEG